MRICGVRPRNEGSVFRKKLRSFQLTVKESSVILRTTGIIHEALEGRGEFEDGPE